MNRITGFTIAMIAALFAGACATTPHEEQSLEQKLADKNYEIHEEIDRIRDYRINGWNYVDDYNVVFQSGPSDHYLLTFNQRCINLRSAHTIAFTQTVGRVTRFDEVLVRDRTGLPAEKCMIDRIYRLEKLKSA